MTVIPEDFKVLDPEAFQIAVLRLDFDAEHGNGSEGFAIPVLARQDGFLLAVPKNFIPQEIIDQGGHAAMDDLVGPSRVVKVPAVLEEDDGTFTPLRFGGPADRFQSAYTGFSPRLRSGYRGARNLPLLRRQLRCSPRAKLALGGHHSMG